jgi:chorismate mutase
VVDNLDDRPDYLIVNSSVLPDVFLKVIEAKRMLDSGRAHSVNEAVQLAGISRSAFYKYKSCVHTFDDHTGGRIVTLQAVLRDEPGVLSQLTSMLYRCGANILTLNQNIPIGGLAPVSVTARIDNLQVTLEKLLSSMRAIEGGEEIAVMLGE